MPPSSVREAVNIPPPMPVEEAACILLLLHYQRGPEIQRAQRYAKAEHTRSRKSTDCLPLDKHKSKSTEARAVEVPEVKDTSSGGGHKLIESHNANSPKGVNSVHWFLVKDTAKEIEGDDRASTSSRRC